MGNMKRLFEEIITLYEEDYSIKEMASILCLSEETILEAVELFKKVEEDI